MGAGGTSATTSRRVMPMRASRSVHGELRMTRDRMGLGRMGLVVAHGRRSRSTHRRRARCRGPAAPRARGRPAMVASRRAVAGIEPVEPAAITGMPAPREAARFGGDQAGRAAPPARWRAALARIDGHASLTMRRESQGELPVFVECGPAPARRGAATAPRG